MVRLTPKGLEGESPTGDFISRGGKLPPSGKVPGAPKGQRGRRVCGSFVPFVKRPFEWEIHGSVNLTNLCFVLHVTWRHRLRFRCHLRQNIVARNALKFDVLPCR